MSDISKKGFIEKIEEIKEIRKKRKLVPLLRTETKKTPPFHLLRNDFAQGLLRIEKEVKKEENSINKEELKIKNTIKQDELLIFKIKKLNDKTRIIKKQK